MCTNILFSSHSSDFCLLIDYLILLGGPSTMFLNQSGSDVISTPLLATFSKLSASLHTHYFVVGGKLHFAKFSYIIRGVSAGTNAFVLARKRFF